MSSNRFPSGPEVMLKSFSDILSYTLSKAIKYNPKTKYKIQDHIVYHYTSSGILPKILLDDNITIRFTDYRFLNDTTEGEELPLFYNKVLNNLHSNDRISQEFYDEMSIAFLNYDLPNIFVACFSRESDSLPMWNYYLKDGKYEGYCLGFRFSSRVLKDFLIPLKVIYNDSEKEKYIEELILSAFDNKSLSIKDRCSELTKDLQQSSLIMKKAVSAMKKRLDLCWIIMRLNIIHYLLILKYNIIVITVLYNHIVM